MKTKLAVFAFSTALVTIGALILPAEAADMSGGAPGSMKDRGPGGVPVPAPMPVEEHYKYYMGAGIGWTAFSSGTLSLGATAGVNGPSIPGYGDLNGPAVVSLTVGRYLTPSIRMELGLDLRTTQKPIRGGAQTYTASVTAEDNYLVCATPCGTPTTTTGTNIYSVTRNEDIKLTSHTFMVNALYDIKRGGRFTPYVGAGVGLALHMINRSTSEYAECVSGSNPSDTTLPTSTTCRNLRQLGSGDHVFGGGDSATGWGLAAALMAGASYNLSDRTHLDFGYRMMWQGGKVAVSAPSLNGVSILNVGNRLDHEFRTGVRVDLW
jgi:opacity protein-like surface antigen